MTFDTPSPIKHALISGPAARGEFPANKAPSNVEQMPTTTFLKKNDWRITVNPTSSKISRFS